MRELETQRKPMTEENQWFAYLTYETLLDGTINVHEPRPITALFI